MIYQNIVEAVFINRPNRFIANCLVNNEKQVVHVKNTGRCRELLIEGRQVYLEYFPNTARKTNYDLISVNKDGRLINMDSQVPNKIVYEALKSDTNILNIDTSLNLIKTEQTYLNSRFDLYAESVNEKIFIEVKGVTLEDNNIAMFPDAPTSRGVKHIMELIKAVSNGYKAYIIFIIQMKNVEYFTPNINTHKEFAEVLQLAYKKGVNILAYDCSVTSESISINQKVEIRL